MEREKLTVIFRHVPAQVCRTCGEQYLEQETSAQLLKQAGELAKSGVEVEVRSYIAA